MKKRGVIWDTMIPWLIAIVVLVLIVMTVGILSGRLEVIGDFIKGIFRSG